MTETLAAARGLHTMNTLGPHAQAVFIAVVLISVLITIAGIVHTIAFRWIGRLHYTDSARWRVLHLGAMRLRKPALWIVVLTSLSIFKPVLAPMLDLPDAYSGMVTKGLAICGFLALGWFLISSVYFVEDALLLRVDVGASNDLKARRLRTQLQLMRRLAITLAIVVDAGLILSLFQNSAIWHYGAGLLASAGLASLVLATAAKSTASNLLAGLQIALTEPIRLDDVVIVEGEWGKIEEITTTYVVVAIWDYRRMIVPLSYFIENPFQNWTREHSDLMGTSFLYVDYSVPVQALRDEFFRLLENSPLWDRKIKALQVTNLSEHTMEIRCLMSATNSSVQFDLRCIVREGMIDFIQKNYPDAFPRTRFSAVSSGERTERSTLQI